MSSSLYIVSPDVLLREDPGVKTVEVDCVGHMGKQTLAETKRVCHPTVGYGFERDGKWPLRTDIWCNHCCHPFEGIPVPIPRSYDEQRRVYYVYGVFCSVNCAKQYILEREPLVPMNRLILFRQMCTDVFGVREPVKPAPPAVTLRRFMGERGLTIEQFRKGFLSPNRIVAEKDPYFVPEGRVFSIWDEYKPEASGRDIVRTLIEKADEKKAFSETEQTAAPESLFDSFLRDGAVSMEVDGDPKQPGTPPQSKKPRRKAADESRKKREKKEGEKEMKRAQRVRDREQKRIEREKKEQARKTKREERERRKREREEESRRKKLEKKKLMEQKRIQQEERDRRERDENAALSRRQGAISAFVKFRD